METIRAVADLRSCADAWRHDGLVVGLVPTMGYLHDGHLSLVERAARECDRVIVTLFVNPLQFAEGEDLASYPRDEPGDAAKAASAGADVLFAPPGEEMYAEPPLTTVTVTEVSARYEGASRPTHFAGVATVVTKLFSIAGPCRAYFGEKDFQQLVVVRRLTADLSLPVEVVGCPTVREDDGLAMSSRNVYLTPEERTAAPVLRRALLAGAASIEAGERDPDRVRATMREVVEAEPLAELDYVDVVDPATMAPVAAVAGELRLVGAVRIGIPRLLDNLGVAAPSD